MNDGGMKQGQRFTVPWRIEYVWLSGVWREPLRLSDGRVERNQLNDSIPPEESHGEGFHLCLSHSGPPLARLWVCFPSKTNWRVKSLDKNPTRHHKTKIKPRSFCSSGLLLHVWHFGSDVQSQPRWFIHCLSLRPRLAFRATKGTSDCFHQEELHMSWRCRSNCQSETPKFISGYTIILSKPWFSYNAHWHLWVPQTVSG